MKRAVLTDVRKLTLEDVPRPACPDDGIIVQVKAVRSVPLMSKFIITVTTCYSFRECWGRKLQALLTGDFLRTKKDMSGKVRYKKSYFYSFPKE